MDIVKTYKAAKKRSERVGGTIMESEEVVDRFVAKMESNMMVFSPGKGGKALDRSFWLIYLKMNERDRSVIFEWVRERANRTSQKPCQVDINLQCR